MFTSYIYIYSVIIDYEQNDYSMYSLITEDGVKHMEMVRLEWLGLRNGSDSPGISDWLLQLSVSNPN